MQGSGKIPTGDAIYLTLSQEAYELPKKRVSTIGLTREIFKYDKGLSDLRTAVYHSPKRLIIAHRGTVPTDQEDLDADLYIASKTFPDSARAKHALRVAKRAIKKYPKLAVSNTGHSLGGATAQFVGSEMPL